MFVVETSALLASPPEQVFAAAAGLEGIVRWQSGVHGLRRPRGRSRTSGPLVLLYHALDRRHVLLAEVTGWAAPRHFAYRAVGEAFALDVALDVEATPQGTHLRYRIGVHTAPEGAAAPAAAPPAAEVGAPPVAIAAPLAAVEVAALRRLVARRTAGDLQRLAARVTALAAWQAGRLERPTGAPATVGAC